MSVEQQHEGGCASTDAVNLTVGDVAEPGLALEAAGLVRGAADGCRTFG